MHYRPATETDIPQLARLRAQAWGTEPYWIKRISGYLQASLHPQQALMPRCMYVAMEGEELAGFVAGHLSTRRGCQGELQWIQVAPAWQGREVAASLLPLLAGWFVENGAKKICVNVEPDNEQAIRFYQKHGATQLDEHWMVWTDISDCLK